MNEKPFPSHSGLSAQEFYSKARRKPQTQLNQIISFNDKIHTQPKTQSNTHESQLNNMMEVNSLLNEEKISFKAVKKGFAIISACIHFVFSLIGKFYILDNIFVFLFLQTAIVLMNILHYHEFSQNQHRIKLIYAHMALFVVNIIGIVHIPQALEDGLVGIMVILVDILMIRELAKILSFMKKIEQEKKKKNEELEEIEDDFDDI